MTPTTDRLFDPATQDRKHIRKRTSIVIPLVLLGGVLGFVFSGAGKPGTTAVVGAICFGVLGLMTSLLSAPPKTTIQCAACRGVGWVDDIRKTNGACPACGHGTFIVSGKHRSGRRLRAESGDTAGGAAILAGEVSVAGEGSSGGHGHGDGGDSDGGGDGGGNGD